MGKYNDWSRGEDEALLNMLGGTDVARAALRGEYKLIVEQVSSQPVTKLPRPSFPSDAIAAQYGYTVEDDVEPSDFVGKKITFVPFCKSGESCKTKAMRRLAVVLKGNYGLVDGQYLVDHQDELIPTEMQGKYIVLPGTKLRDSDGRRHVAYLYFRGDRWVLYFNWESRGWNGNDRFACSESLGT